MRFGFKKVLYPLALFAGLTDTAMANQVTIANISAVHQPMSVVYQVAHKNAGQSAVLSAPQAITVTEAVIMPVNLAGFDFAGVVPLSVNGHVIPSDANQFAEPEQCSLTTDKTHPAGILQFAAKASPTTPHRSMSCSVRGGVFN